MGRDIIKIDQRVNELKSRANPSLVLGYFQQAKTLVSVIDGNECFLRKGYPFPMLATEHLILFVSSEKERIVIMPFAMLRS